MTAFSLVGATSFGCCVWYQLVELRACVCGCSAEADVNAGQHSCSSKRERRRLDVATDCPAARDLFVIVACCWYLARASDWMTFVSCIAVVDFLPGCEGERKYRTLISLLGSLATMRRVVNYHSSWARQQQVELFDASGNPGSTAGRGFNPAGGAPGGG
ncbi:hypothetical protein F511_29242 [Dorcoceras hygrometricum]|uniref:Uncharacterized protein n=1 Tax=Dorcoceras hygrometricum TaxID=472368 RepID=A0A2Z7D9Z8_9LAMI|nr:hypothetical protein F511_29242 [Dorcoceras hygrometricum]